MITLIFNVTCRWYMFFLVSVVLRVYTLHSHFFDQVSNNFFPKYNSNIDFQAIKYFQYHCVDVDCCQHSRSRPHLLEWGKHDFTQHCQTAAVKIVDASDDSSLPVIARWCADVILHPCIFHRVSSRTNWPKIVFCSQLSHHGKESHYSIQYIVISCF